MVELLLAAGADPDVHADTYVTLLNLAYRNIDPEIAIRMVEILLEHGADPNIRDNNYGAPLHRVCRTRPRAFDPRLARTFLNGGADANLRDKNGVSALKIRSKKRGSWRDLHELEPELLLFEYCVEKEAASLSSDHSG